MDLKKIEIQTSRLQIRNLIESDLEAFLEYRSNPEVTKYQGFDVMNKKEAAQFIAKQKDKLFGEPGEWVQYAIVLKSTNTLIGDCAIQLKKDPRIAEVGVTVSHLHQRSGFGKEAFLGILKFLFEEAGVRRVAEIVDVENDSSIYILEQCGFRREGHFVENIFFKGSWGSEYQYAMLKREWDEKHGSKA